MPETTAPPYPTLGQAARVWAKIGLLSFGGPAGQIAMMHRVLVEEERWLDEARFLHALNYCMVLPGPEAQQLTVYVGWLMHRTAGGLIAGLLFIAPGVAAIMALSWLYAIWGDVSLVQGLFFGLKAAVLAIVLQAVWRIGARALGNRAMRGIAGLAFISIFVFDVPFPLIVATAGAIGLAGAALGLHTLGARAVPASVQLEPEQRPTVLGHRAPPHTQVDVSWALRISAVFLFLWLLPVIGLSALLGSSNVFSEIARFFSVMAVVTFGGAYAVLAYVTQEAVTQFGWLAPGEMLDGLGMAETTPGPLIMVTQFVGFMAALREPGSLPPVLAGTLGGLLTTWVTFVPCFLWIFLGAPFIESLRNNRWLSAALKSITAAIVGVIANLAVWFGLHVLFGTVRMVERSGIRIALPELNTFDPLAGILALGCAVGLVLLKWPVHRILLAAAIAGATLAGLGLR